jgi:phosphoribosyl 1,2-cyclic phosphodiesterase
MEKEGNWIKFLGTAGARIVVAKQLRSSGGTWLHFQNTNLLLDPGPGSLVRALSSKPALDPSHLDAVILSHKHLDHSADVNVIIEAMTEGGFNKRGVLFAPQDALDEDPVVLKYLRGFVERIEILEEGGRYQVGGIAFSTPLRHRHSVQTYGLSFQLPEGNVSFVADTALFPALASAYKSDLLVVNVVLHHPHPNPNVQHLCLAEASQLIREVHPKVAVLTHFGMGMLRAKPWELALALSRETGVNVIAARDGMTVDLAEVLTDVRSQEGKG